MCVGNDDGMNHIPLGGDALTDFEHSVLAQVHPIGRLKGSWLLIAWGCWWASLLLPTLLHPDLQTIQKLSWPLVIAPGILVAVIVAVALQVQGRSAAGLYALEDRLRVQPVGKKEALDIPWDEIEAVVVRRRLRESLFDDCATLFVHGPDGQVVKLPWISNANSAAWRLRRRVARAWLEERVK